MRRIDYDGNRMVVRAAGCGTIFLCMGLIEERRTRSIIGAFYEVYNTLGYGFLEKVYQNALERELLGRGHGVQREVLVDVVYKGSALAQQRIDMIVDQRIVVEIKSTTLLHPAATRQIHNYLRGTSLQVGLLLHFGPKPAFHRLVFTGHRSQSAKSAPSASSA